MVLVNLPLSTNGTAFGITTSTIHPFAMLNTIIWAILVTSVRPSAKGYGDFMSFRDSVCGQEKEEMTDQNDNGSTADSDDYQYDFSDTDGHDEVNDGNGEYDDTLDSRIEEFIAKVIRGWREEQMGDNLKIKQVD